MILNSWKEIASYLNCSVRTAQRSERDGLPVRRPSGHLRSAVVAMSDEIDAWRVNSRNGTPRPLPIVSQRKREMQAQAVALRRQMAECRAHSGVLRERMRAMRMRNIGA